MKNKRYLLQGIKGMVGSAIYRKLQEDGYTNLITQSSSELDLRNQTRVDVVAFCQ